MQQIKQQVLLSNQTTHKQLLSVDKLKKHFTSDSVWTSETVTERQHTFNNLPSVTKCWFRVIAVGRHKCTETRTGGGYEKWSYIICL